MPVWPGWMTEAPPTRAVFLTEGVLSHGALQARLERFATARRDLRPSFAAVPPPTSREARLVRRFDRIGDLDLQPLRWRLRWSHRARRLLEQAEQEAADVAFVNSHACALLSGPVMRRLPTVLSVDATGRQFSRLEYWRPRNRFSPAHDRILEQWERRAFASAAMIHAWTDWTADSLRREYNVPEHRITTLHLGVDAGALAVDRAPGSAEAPLQLLFVGNGARRKGLDVLLAAVDSLGSAAELDLVSTDEDLPARPGLRVHHDVRPNSLELRRRFAEADVLVHPTRADAAPWVVVEAMAAGLPVVASAVGAIPELVGDTGLVVPRDDPAALARTLQDLAADPARRHELGRRARRRVEERYDSATQLDRLADLLRAVARRPADAR